MPFIPQSEFDRAIRAAGSSLEQNRLQQQRYEQEQARFRQLSRNDPEAFARQVEAYQQQWASRPNRQGLIVNIEAPNEPQPFTIGDIEQATTTFWRNQPDPEDVARLRQAQQREADYARWVENRRYGQVDLDPPPTPAADARGAFVNALREEMQGTARDMRNRFNDELFRTNTANLTSPPTPTQEEDLMESESLPAKRIRKILLRYPYAIEHLGRSYRLSYFSKKRRWLVQEWDNSACKTILKEMVRGQRPAELLRQSWIQERTRSMAEQP